MLWWHCCYYATCCTVEEALSSVGRQELMCQCGQFVSFMPFHWEPRKLLKMVFGGYGRRLALDCKPCECILCMLEAKNIFNRRAVQSRLCIIKAGRDLGPVFPQQINLPLI